MKLQQWLRRLGSDPWNGWPEKAYKQDRYQQRLLRVQEQLVECLNMAPPGPVRVVSICAGDGRDVIDVLARHPRRKDVSAWLVEMNRRSVAAGIRRTQRVGLEHTVKFLAEDATVYETYKNIAPSDILLVCGVWGHVFTHERAHLVDAMTSLCKPGGSVIWTRGVSKGLFRLHEIQSLFAEPSWAEVRISFTSDNQWAVVANRFCGPASELPGSGWIFHFKPKGGV